MPLFVILSGHFSKQKPLKDTFFSNFRLLRLFILFQALDILIKLWTTQNFPSFISLLTPCFALWYLLCLFYWRILLSIIPKSWKAPYLILASVIISILIGFIPIKGIMGFQRFFSFMPYFMLGHYYGASLMKYIDSKSISISFVYKIIVIFLFLIIASIVSFNPYWLDAIISPYSSHMICIHRILYLIYSFFLSFLLILIVNFKHNWGNNLISQMGCNTLFFYLVHPYILYSIIKLWMLKNNTINIIDSILITSLVVLILFGLEKIKIIRTIIS